MVVLAVYSSQFKDDIKNKVTQRKKGAKLHGFIDRKKSYK